MSTALPSAARTLVVILGGSTYPNKKSFDNERLKRSAESLRSYFCDPTQFGLRQEQLLWLFDSTDGPNTLNDRIEAFLKGAAARQEDERPLDVIVCFVGHGFFDEDKYYYLATPSFRPGAPEYSYRFRLLQRTVKQCMQQARKYFILDACYSAAAAGEMMAQSAEPYARQIIHEVKQDAPSDLPERGTALLCAASKDDQALMPQESDCTMFTGALLAVLEQPDPRAQALNLRQLYAQIKARIDDQFGAFGVSPEIHSPDQKEGDVGAIPLFRLRRRGDELESGEAPVRDALDPAAFADPDLLHAVVVCRGDSSGGLPPLTQHLFDAWHNHYKGITAAAGLCRAAWRAEAVPADLGEEALVVAQLAVERAFTSEQVLGSAVAAMCRADIAVFDLSDWDAGATFLLGVRSVVRRGVTITSIASAHGKEFRLGSGFEVPFNLQLLNLASHSEAQEKEGAGKRPFELLGGKIESGFRELANLPHYLDLPAYEAIRQLGTESGAYRAIPIRERVLVLCPFNDIYERTNWSRLERMLPSCVQDYVVKTEDRKDAAPPALSRLLDLRTPRLVSQTLFESIRLTEMCVIDWTTKRPNVVFEAGARLAAHPLGAVHIVEESAWARMQRDDPADEQVLAILRLLQPIAYPLKGVSKAFNKMVDRFAACVQANKRGESQVVYASAGAYIDRRSQPAALPLVNELRRSAGMLDPEDDESAGVSAVLYRDVNDELGSDAKEAAADRRLAAWLFLTRRYAPEDIAGDPVRLEQFEFLTPRVRRWARRARRSDLVDEINAAERAVASLSTTWTRG